MRQLKHLSLLLGLLLLGPSTYAQSVRFQSQAISSRGAGIANATVAVCTQPANTNTQPCSPLATLATSTSTTSGGANPLTADSFGNFFFYAAPGRYTVQIYGPAVSGQFVTPDVILSCDPTACSVATFSGPSPWFDITAPPFNAACNSNVSGTIGTDDTTAIQNAISQANNSNNPGATVFSPPGRFCKIAGFIGINNTSAPISIVGGFGPRSFSGNPQSTWVFTGTGVTNTPLQIKASIGISFSNISLIATNITTAPFIDLTGSSFIAFHGIAFGGPSAASTICPLILDVNTNNVNFDNFTTFNNAGCFVQGPSSNSVFSDKTSFVQVQFQNPTLEAIVNPSINWTVDKSIYQMFQAGSTCTPFFTFTGGYTGFGNFLAIGSEFNSTGGNCTNAFTLFGPLPAASGNLGGIQLISNLFIAGTSAGSQTLISTGNNQSIGAFNNTFANFNALFALGVTTGVVLNANGNIFQNVTNFLSGNNPQTGTATDLSGNVFFWAGQSAVEISTGLALTGLLSINSGAYISRTSGNLLFSSVAPTISSGFGTSPSIPSNNGTLTFRVNVGTGGTASSGVVGLTAATNHWNCSAYNITAHLGNRADDTVVTASNATTVTVQNQTKSTGAAVAWTASDIVVVSCTGE